MAKRFLTPIDGSTASLTGRVTASAFAGDGSALTNLPPSTSSAFNNLSASGTASINNLSITSSSFQILDIEGNPFIRIDDKKRDIYLIPNNQNIPNYSVRNTLIGASINYIPASGSINTNIFGPAENVSLGFLANPNQEVPTASANINNIAIGNEALRNNISGGANIAIGNSALSEHIKGSDNVAVGLSNLFYTIYGQNNTAIGSNAGGHIEGNDNTALGFGALYGSWDVYTGVTSSVNRMTAIGTQALANLSASSAYQNTALGYDAGRYLQSGSYNVIIGSNTGSAIDGLSNNIIVSDGVGNTPLRINVLTDTASFTGTIDMVSSASVWDTYGYGGFTGPVHIGPHPLDGSAVRFGLWTLDNLTAGGDNIAIGRSALQYASVSQGNVAVGGAAIGSLYDGANDIGSYNTAVGTFALANPDHDVLESAAFGYAANAYPLMSWKNSAFGAWSLSSITGSGNVALGHNAFNNFNVPDGTASGSYNTIVGSDALNNNFMLGNYNIAIGWKSASALQYGSANVVIGSASLSASTSNKVIISDGVGDIVFAADGLANTASITGKLYSASFIGDGSGLTGIAAGGGVTQIIAGTNVTISPVGGTGSVTINATGGSSAPESDQNILAVAIFS